MGATQQALPTVTGFAVKCAIAALRQRSTDPGPLLHRAGLAEGDLGAPQRRVSAVAQGEFLEHAALALNDPMFGLHLAQQSNPREVGLLFYAMSAAESVSEALTLLMHCCGSSMRKRGAEIGPAAGRDIRRGKLFRRRAASDQAECGV